VIKYDKYKPSGVEWIGEIPEHWNVATIGRVSNLGRGRVISNIEIGENEGGYPVYSSQTENNGVMGRINTFDFEGEYVTWTTDGANAGTVFYRSGKFNCTNVCGTIQPKNWEQLELRFLPYFLNLGTRYSVRLDINPKLMNNMMAKIPLVIPPKPEQTAIANYLDEKTTQIDTLIAKKQRLIELLKEERSAVINDAVTKGINPNAKLRPSGSEWLGDIPKHWEVKKLKYVLDGKLKYGANEVAEFENENDPRYIRITDFGDDGKLLNDTFKSLPYEIAKEYLLFEGDILFARSGATVGKTFQFKNYNGDACYAGYLIKATPNKDIIYSDYLYYFTKSNIYENWKNSIYNQATIQNIGADKYGILEIIIPVINDQILIVQYIETEIQKIEKTIAKIEKDIELMQEYRTALISEVVTGKVKVA
jgi:type I restriction enzyme, S subunit